MSGSEDIVGLLRELAARCEYRDSKGTYLACRVCGANYGPDVVREHDADCPVRVALATLDVAASGETSTPIGSIAAGDADSNASLKAELSRLSEQVEKQGKVVELATKVADAISGHHYHTGNNETVQTPAHSIWGRENPNCDVCQSVYEYRAALNGLVVVGEEEGGLPAAERQDGVADDRASHLRDRSAAQ